MLLKDMISLPFLENTMRKIRVVWKHDRTITTIVKQSPSGLILLLPAEPFTTAYFSLVLPNTAIYLQLAYSRYINQCLLPLQRNLALPRENPRSPHEDRAPSRSFHSPIQSMTNGMQAIRSIEGVAAEGHC